MIEGQNSEIMKPKLKPEYLETRAKESQLLFSYLKEELDDIESNKRKESKETLKYGVLDRFSNIIAPMIAHELTPEDLGINKEEFESIEKRLAAIIKKVASDFGAKKLSEYS